MKSYLKKKHILKIIGTFLLVLFLLLLGYSFYPLITYSPDTQNTPGNITVYDRYGKLITHKSKPNGYFIPFHIAPLNEGGRGELGTQSSLVQNNPTPPHLPLSGEEQISGYDKKEIQEIPFIQALTTIEDKNFFSHFGVDIFAKGRAVTKNLLAGKRLGGGSTITEQYVKNTYFIGVKRGYLQKLREAILSVYVSLTMSKQEVMEGYLNAVYFGNNIYGLQSAMKVYFQKDDISKLTPEEIVLLMTLIHNPSEHLKSPVFQSYFDLTQKRLGLTFERTIFTLPKFEKFDEFPFISQKAEAICQKPHPRSISLSPSTGSGALRGASEGNLSKMKGEKDSPQGEEQGSNKTILGGKDSIQNRFLPSQEGQNIKKGDFTFFTSYDCSTGVFHATIDRDLSLFARKTLGNSLDELGEKNVSNGAIFAVQPLTQEVLIYEGSRDFYSTATDGQVDVILQPRQMGSTLKPFLYLYALKSGYNPDSLLIDIQSEYNSFKNDTTYISENYSLKEYGLVRLKKALGNSLNNASVRLARELGLEKVYDFYVSQGFHFEYPAEHYGYSLVLGNPSITLHDLVASYINILPKPEGEKGSIDTEKFLLYDILKNPDNRDISFGVNSILSTSIPQAVKTGTSTDFRDNALVSYSPDMVIGIWIGNNDNSSMIGVTGISGAGYTWHHIIEESIKRGYIRDMQIRPPVGVEEVSYCLDTPCYQKEISFQKQGTEYFSRIRDNSYDKRDIRGDISLYEKKKLSDLGFELR